MNSKIIFLVVICLALLIWGTTCFATKIGDLAPTQTDIDRTIDRVEQDKAQKEFLEKQERERDKSPAEKEIDKIPKKTTVGPTFHNGGVGVKVTIPTN